MKKICLLISIFFVMLFSFTAQAKEETFSYLLNRKIITRSDIKNPDRNITRQEFIVMLSKAFDFNDQNPSKCFNDVPETSANNAYFSGAYKAGWLKGDEYGNLNPKDPLIRSEAAALLGRIAHSAESGPLTFKDVNDIPLWASSYISGLENLDIIHGHTDNTFKPNDNLTFYEGCILVKNALVNSFSKGDGSKANPFVIEKPFHFLNIRLYPAGHFVLNNNLYFGEDVIFDSIKNFSGTLDGKGFKITGLKTTISNNQTVFETNDGEIKNLNLVLTDTFVSLCHTNNGKITYCGNSSFVYDESKNYFLSDVGAISVINNGKIYGCYNSSFLPGSSDNVAAGISYINNGTIENSLNTANGTGKTAGISYMGSGLTDFSINTGNVTYPINFQGEIKNSYYSNYGSFKNGVFKAPGSIFRFTNKEEFDYSRAYNIPVLKNILYIHKENFSDFSGGDGSKLNPFVVSSATQFMNIAKYKNSYFIQKNDIDMSYVNSYTPVDEFLGVYDGNGYSLLNLKLTKPDRSDVALFKNNKGTVKNLKCLGFYITGNKNVSTIAVNNSGSIQNVFADSLIKGSTSAGICVTNDGFITSTAFSGLVSGTLSGGGICLYNNNLITDCLSDGDISGGTASGISQENNGGIENSCFFGELFSNQSCAISFDNNADINNCYYKSGYVSSLNNHGNITAYSRTESQATVLSAFENLNLNLWAKGTSYPVLSFVPSISLPENYSDFAGGNGTLNNPYKIVSPLQLENVRKYQNSAFILVNDIDMSLLTKSGGAFYNDGKGFLPFDEFGGVFFGNGKTISGLNMKREISALFLKNTGVITNLITKKFNLKGDNISAIVYENYGTVAECINYSSLSGTLVAGIALYNNGSIYECINSAEFKGLKVSGISTFGSGVVENSMNAGSIMGDGENFTASGISLENKVYTSLNTGDIFSFYGKGEIYPISKTDYKNSYYLNRYNQTLSGGLTLKELMNPSHFTGFNFEFIWEEGSHVPVLKSLGKNEINLPHAFSGGNGTLKNPYSIKNIDDLYNIRMYPDANFILANDITFDKNISIYNQYGKGFAPIPEFTGILDGNGHTIYGIEILGSLNENAGLIAINYGTVKNLTLNRFTVEGNLNAGAVSGKNRGTIENVKVLGSRIGSYCCAGGITGENLGKITNCLNSSDIFGTLCSGGISGINYQSVLRSTSKGGVIASSFNTSSYAGGISGENRGKIVECEVSGKVLSYSENFESIAGGISGLSKGNISDCFNSADVTAKAKTYSYSGGIVGKTKEKIIISSCYNIGYGTANSEIPCLGSICASGYGSITKSCYDETLAAPVQEGSFTYSKVYPVTPTTFSDKSWSEFLGKDLWETIPSDYQYPQLKNNPHKNPDLSDNIRDFAGGNGSAENPYLIMTAAQLDNVRYYLGSCFELLTDIDMTSYVRKNNFKPIGENMFAFFGIFLGSEKTLSGLPESTTGLFAANHGDIYDLTLKSSGSGIANLNTGVIYRCFVKDAEIVAKNQENALLGGIANTNYSSGMIISSAFDGKIEINGVGGQAGGIVSGNYGHILGCEFKGDILINANSYAIAGGISAFSYGSLTDTLNNGKIVVNCPTQSISGGIVGTLGGYLINSVSYPKTMNAPALAGNVTSGEIINCYYKGFDNYGSLITDETIFDGFDFETMWYISDNNKMCLYW